MTLGLQFFPEMRLNDFRLWLGIVAAGVIVAFLIWVLRGKVGLLREKPSRCQHEFEEYDAVGNFKIYKCT